jgi:hypothetical protein
MFKSNLGRNKDLLFQQSSSSNNHWSTFLFVLQINSFALLIKTSDHIGHELMFTGWV